MVHMWCYYFASKKHTNSIGYRRFGIYCIRNIFYNRIKWKTMLTQKVAISECQSTFSYHTFNHSRLMIGSFAFFLPPEQNTGYWRDTKQSAGKKRTQRHSNKCAIHHNPSVHSVDIVILHNNNNRQLFKDVLNVCYAFYLAVFVCFPSILCVFNALVSPIWNVCWCYFFCFAHLFGAYWCNYRQ